MPAEASLFAHHAAEFTGTVVHDAQARLKQIDTEGHMVPVIVFDVESDTALHMPLQVVQTFAPGAMAQAEAAARRYRKGLRVTVQAPVVSVRLAVTASHIHTHRPETSPETHPEKADA